MAGSLTLGGMSAGQLAGSMTLGPATVTGKTIGSEVIEITLEANVDFAVKIPPEKTQWAVFFTFASSAPEVKVGSNLVTTANGMPVPAQGFVSAPIVSGMTELKFKAVSPPSVFQLVFI